MNISKFTVIEKKVIIKLKDRVCETAEELLESAMFRDILNRCLDDIYKKNSPLLKLFSGQKPAEEDVSLLIKTFVALSKCTGDVVPGVVKGSERYVKNPALFRDFVEHLYNFWRVFDRYIVCDSTNDKLDQRPYRTFNTTIEKLMHLVRAVYRDIQGNVTGTHSRVYRQVTAGAEVATIAVPGKTPLPEEYKMLSTIPVIRQILVYPPQVVMQPNNKRSGKFALIDQNPLEKLQITSEEWLCYPARVGTQIIHVYIHQNFYELGFAMCNLFDIADDSELQRKPDAIYAFGMPEESTKHLKNPTAFYEDKKNGLFVGACPYSPEFGYFGYLKKMILTMHNAIVMRKGHMPFHGALVKITLRGGKKATILNIGDTGAGKSETLEAFRTLAKDQLEDMTIVADDMGSLQLDTEGNVIGYGTEIGAFLRLDDLPPGHAFGQMDRAIIMNPNQVNARIVLPVTTYEEVIKGAKIDIVLYANNYELTDEDHPIVQKFDTVEAALAVFREGTSMSKGTTTAVGLTHSYFANPFGAPQYKELHEEISKKYFAALFNKKVYVGQMRTRLGIPGYEYKGPEEAAQQLLKIIGG